MEEGVNVSVRNAQGRGLAALISGAVCIGFAPVWVRWSEVGPIPTAFHRIMLALPALALWAWWERPRNLVEAGREQVGPRRQLLTRETAWIIAAGVFFALDLAAWHSSIHLTSVANATLLANFAPVFVMLGAWVFLGERVGIRFLAGMVIALAGAWLLTGARFGTSPLPQFRGDMIALLTAVFYGGYQLCVARLRRGLPPGRTLFFSSLVTAPVLGVMAWVAGDSLVPPTLRAWLILAALAISAQVMGQGLITYGFAHLPAGYSSLTLLVQPAVATLTGWWLFGERVDLARALGAVVLLAGLFVARRRV